MEGDEVEGGVVGVSRDDVVQVLKEMITGNDCRPSDVSLELIVAAGK